jgi:hypothetical protein
VQIAIYVISRISASEAWGRIVGLTDRHCSEIEAGKETAVPIEPIDVAPEVKEARQALNRLIQALKSPDYREQHAPVMQEWLAAEQRRREAWLAMATPLPTTE